MKLYENGKLQRECSMDNKAGTRFDEIGLNRAEVKDLMDLVNERPSRAAELLGYLLCGFKPEPVYYKGTEIIWDKPTE